jgi:hypothetical protein
VNIVIAGYLGGKPDRIRGRSVGLGFVVDLEFY